MEPNNLELYDRVRSVPPSAQKPIQAGRLRGKTDINPMWRIKMLTETFGPCGFGWRYDIVRMWTEAGAAGEVAAFVHLNLYVNHRGEWSQPIQGVGGSAFIAAERNGLYTSDECYKMALTDAISVACKALGFAADIYWSNDASKYDPPRPPATPTPQPPAPQPTKKIIPPDRYADPAIMRWIADKEGAARTSGTRFSILGLLEAHYGNTKEELQQILTQYEQYKINNNLP